MDPEVQQALLQDPGVQIAVKKAGQDALADPAMQQYILDICREKFPGSFADARTQIGEWANDPEVQRRACEYAGVARLYAGQAIGYAGQAAGQAGEQLEKLIEQGPAGVRILAFFGGIGSCVNAGFTLWNPLQIVFGPIAYLIAFYQAIFSITTALFEAEPGWIQQIPGLNAYQDAVIDQAKFLTEVAGRGIFYGFQGTLWLALASFKDLQNICLGLYFIVLAVLHISMHFGVMPQHIVQKIREAQNGDYILVPLSLDDSHLQSGGVSKVPSLASVQSEVKPFVITPPAEVFEDQSGRCSLRQEDAFSLEAFPTGNAMQISSIPTTIPEEPVAVCHEGSEKVKSVRIDMSQHVREYTPEPKPIRKTGAAAPPPKDRCCILM